MNKIKSGFFYIFKSLELNMYKIIAISIIAISTGLYGVDFISKVISGIGWDKKNVYVILISLVTLISFISIMISYVNKDVIKGSDKDKDEDSRREKFIISEIIKIRNELNKLRITKNEMQNGVDISDDERKK